MLVYRIYVPSFGKGGWGGGGEVGVSGFWGFGFRV